MRQHELSRFDNNDNLSISLYHILNIQGRFSPSFVAENCNSPLNLSHMILLIIWFSVTKGRLIPIHRKGGIRMTVKQLIEKLKELPQDKEVWIGTKNQSVGEVENINEYTAFVELETEY